MELAHSRTNGPRYRSAAAASFILIAVAALAGSAWLLVAGEAGHGLKDFWQHRRRYVADTRWWPPFCLVVDWIAAAIIAIELLAGPPSPTKRTSQRDHLNAHKLRMTRGSG